MRAENICVSSYDKSRRATNTDAILDPEEITAHQAVLSLHSRLREDFADEIYELWGS